MRFTSESNLYHRTQNDVNISEDGSVRSRIRPGRKANHFSQFLESFPLLKGVRLSHFPLFMRKILTKIMIYPSKIENDNGAEIDCIRVRR